ncbi:hypothetical protein ZWY2020_034861 [Hordeum vulgare]|nr:hypothetical protein ZWY2020_034861 [Hordeum vulgare]
MLQKKILPRGRRRVDVFSLAFHVGQLAQPDLKRCLDYAAKIEDSDLRRRRHVATPAGAGQGVLGLSVHFPVGSPLLARLSVRGLHLTTVGAANLRSLIVVDCSRTTELRVLAARRLLPAHGPSLKNLFSATRTECSA